ncbi:fructose-1,6-bisphosphatase [Segatella oris]|uniref:Fructose-1,6-bisphosphatase class 3 n=1 Tax=Segatella oris C735 TaxID=563008 RepID=D7NAU7_9BACT|nr:fructose-1,6-bisphosphatase [Segatella oris]EFI49402.1 fructose-1,6-bisphosphatase [Segatella oris C735]
MKKYNIEKDMRYLQLLANSFPTIANASTEIINLQAILNLPKGTEHFLADIHGEYEAFQHVLKNASGNIKRKVNELFGNTLREQEKRELCSLIYYPEQKLELVKVTEEDINDWYHITLHQLVAVCRTVSSKYTRSKVRKSLPADFSYIIQELLHEHTENNSNKTAYVNVIVDTIISTGRADDFIIAICNVIQRLAIDQLHILGDIYDRGPGAHIIMDTMAGYHSWDIQWGNHDILWMGACAGNDACICNVIRLSLRYANLTTLEEGYGINLVPLATFAMEVYKDDPCEEFMPRLSGGAKQVDEKTLRLTAQMHKAIAVIQFKEEAQLFEAHPEWKMQDRELFKMINYEKGTILLNGKEYPLTSCNFPTIAPKHPCALTFEEKTLMGKLHHSFRVSEKLHKHIRLMLQHGCMYAIRNDNLLFHASIPLNDDGTLKEVEIEPGRKYKGRELMQQTGMLIRAAFQDDSTLEEKKYAIDYFIYLWCGPNSPLFDKDKMATFERYFIADKSTHKEEKGNYFLLRDNEKIVDYILDAFGVKGANRHIINGHVPVHVANGENPIKASGKLMVIDGGFSQAYHKETGIAGYTLVYHSRGFQLVQHEPFTSAADAVQRGTDIKSTTQIVEMSSHRMLVADTDKGIELKKQIEDLEELLYAYRHGIIGEKESKK